MSEWNDAISAAQHLIPASAETLSSLKRPDAGGSCLHPELTFDSGDYMLICHVCNSRWVMVAPGREQGINKDGMMVGGDPSIANKGDAAHLSGHRRVKTD